MRMYCAAEAVTSYDSNPVVVPLLCPAKTVVQSVPVALVWMSNRALRWSPLYQAILTEPTLVGAARSKRIHCPSPFADQRVVREPSSALAGKFPSLALSEVVTGGRRSEIAPITLPAQAVATTITANSTQPSLFRSLPNDGLANRLIVRTDVC